jgi:flagellar protein FliO/FliZ
MIRPYLFPLPLLATAEAFAQAPQAAATADLGGSLWQMFLGLALVLALMVGSLWLLKKLVVQRGESSGLVLGVAPGRVSALAEVPRQAGGTLPGSAAIPPSEGFPDWLRKVTQRK